MSDRFLDPRSEWILRRTIIPFIKALWRPTLVDNGHFPEGPCFIYGNHSNNLDPFILNVFTRTGHPTSGVMTQEYLKKGAVGWLMRGIGLLGTRKQVPEPHLIKKIYKRLDAGRAVVIYPEGGRRWNGRPAPWIETTAKLFIKAGVPVYPVLTHGSYVGWPRWARFPRPARIQVECLPPLHFERKTPLDEAMSRLKPLIAQDDTIVADERKPRWAYRPADGIHRLLYRDPATGENGGLVSPDGTRVVNRAGTLQWTMQPDSLLRDDQTGTLHSTADLYAQIRALPLEKDADGAFLQNRVDFSIEDAKQNLEPRGSVHAVLYDDALRLRGEDLNLTLPLEDIRYTGIERNLKLQLSTENGFFQLSFTGEGSALQWEDTLKHLRSGN